MAAKLKGCTPDDTVLLNQLVNTGQVAGVSFSPDGTRIAYALDQYGTIELYVVGKDGGFPRRLTVQGVTQDFRWGSRPVWSPDGRWIAYTSAVTGTPHVYIISPDTGAFNRVSAQTSNNRMPAWSPDSGQVAYVAAHEDSDIIVLTRLGHWPQPLTSLGTDAQDPQWSPDGKHIAYVRTSPGDLHNSDIMVISLESGDTAALTGGVRSEDYMPRWSPDGSRLAFVSDRSGFDELWIVDWPEGSVKQLTSDGRDKRDFAWAPAGGQLAYTVVQGGNVYLESFRLESGDTSPLLDAAGVAGSVSFAPAGDRITFTWASAGVPADIFTLDLSNAEAKPARITDSRSALVAGADFVPPEDLWYESGGLQVHGLLYLPDNKPDGGLAAVVNPHGGPTAQSVNNWQPFVQYLVSKGYAVLAPNFRGSTGYGRDFRKANVGEWGSGDLQDVCRGAEALGLRADINTSRIGVYGGSYGGYMTLLALGKSPETFAAGVALYGVSNRVSDWSQADRIGRRGMQKHLGRPSDNPELYYTSSAVNYVGNMRAPLLLLHGEKDPRVPFAQTTELIERLKAMHRYFEFHAYPNEAHGFRDPATKVDSYRRIYSFLERYV